MRIPDRFKIFGTTISVVVSQEPFKDTDAIGFCSYRLNQIQINPIEVSHKRTEEQLEKVFWHEIMHLVVYHAEDANSNKKDHLHQEEGFIDLAGKLMHQIINTFEYDS